MSSRPHERFEIRRKRNCTKTLWVSSIFESAARVMMSGGGDGGGEAVEAHATKAREADGALHGRRAAFFCFGGIVNVNNVR